MPLWLFKFFHWHNYLPEPWRVLVFIALILPVAFLAQADFLFMFPKIYLACTGWMVLMGLSAIYRLRYLAILRFHRKKTIEHLSTQT